MNEMTQTAKQMKQTVEELINSYHILKLNSHSKDIPLPRGIFLSSFPALYTYIRYNENRYH